MVEYSRSNYEIKDVYQGGYSSLEPNYGGFSGYRANASKLGVSTDPRSANILNEVAKAINPGQKNVELEWLSPEVMDSIPKQHLKEVNRMAKLTGIDVSVHGPIVEASGMSKEGFTEGNREAVERRIVQTLERAYEVNPNGTNVVFHSSAMLPSPEIRKIPEEERRRKGIKETEEVEKMLMIDQESGNINYLDKTVRYDLENPDYKKGREISAKEHLKIINSTRWDDSLNALVDPLERANNILEGERVEVLARNTLKFMHENNLTEKDLTSQQKDVLMKYRHAETMISDVTKGVNGIFERAYKYGSSEDKEEVDKLQKNFLKNLKENREGGIKSYAEALDNLIYGLKDKIRNVQLVKSVDDFSMEKSSMTFGNAAFQAYKKYGDKTPVISIENPPAGYAFSRGEDLKNMVLKSREQFVKRAVEFGMDKKEAERNAEKVIGATWDVGHINMIKKFGFDDKDVVKETERVAPYVKHVHLSDNFGMEHTELPMGMGNVPLKEMMEKLGKKGEEAKKIIEAGNWFQHFQVSPVAQSFESMGVPFYAQGRTPYFNQTAGYEEGYFSGKGQMLPDMNYQTFGAGFSQLPMELGGSSGGRGRSRLSGAPLE
jgi:hypothetical protein